MSDDDKIIAICGSGVFLLDGYGRIQQELLKENVACSPGCAAISTSRICIPLLEKAKIIFVGGSQHYKASVPEIVMSVEFSKCGELLFAGSKSGKLYIWQMQTGDLIKCCHIFHNSITNLKVDPRNSTLLCSSLAGELLLLNLVEAFMGMDTGTEYVGHCSGIVGVANLIHGPYENSLSFASVSRDKNLRLWHSSRQNSLCSVQLEHEPLSLEVGCYGDKLFVPGYDGKIAVVYPKDLESIFYLSGHIGPVMGCVESKNLVTSALDGIRIWDVNSGICLGHWNSIGPNVIRLFTCVNVPDSQDRIVPLKNFAQDNKDFCTRISLSNLIF